MIISSKYFSTTTSIYTCLLCLTLLSATGCSAKKGDAKTTEVNSEVKEVPEIPMTAHSERATFAMGCFWHSEEIFLEIKGVKDALPGYSGGTEKNPSYEMVSSGTTGHTESVDITFDPTVISYEKLLQVFFTEHDPTTPNMAYPDEGTQYRSAIFYHSPEQKKQAEAYIAKINASHTYSKPVITELAAFTKFYRAEDYHLRYYRNHPTQSYIAHVTIPEVQKFQKDFPDLVK